MKPAAQALPSVEDIERIIHRMTRVAPRGDLVLADYSAREVAIAIRDLFKGTALDDARLLVVYSEPRP